MAPSSYGDIHASDNTIIHLGDNYNTLESEAIKADTARLVTADERDEREAILKWIHPDPHWTIHDRKHSDQGSCDWLLQSPNFVKWSESETATTFWLRGKMGFGKSHLTHAVIERTCSQHAVAYFYCNESIGLNDMLRTILKQLVSVRASSPLPAVIVETFKKKQDQRPPNRTECVTLMNTCTTGLSSTEIAIDALDECPANARDELMHTLITWMQRNPS